MGRLRFMFLTLNVWLCLGSGLMVGISALALSVPLASVGAGLALPPLLFYFIYVEDRRDVSPEDELNRPLRTALVRRYQRPLLATELAALVGYEALLGWFAFARLGLEAGVDVRVGVLAFLLGQLPLVVLALYERLKRRPSFDSLAVGATWAFTVTFALVVSTGLTVTAALGGVFLAWLLIAFAGVESRNVPDARGDAEADRTTLAGHLGPERATALVGLVKLAGVAVFWAVSGPGIAALAAGYLGLLRLFRTLTARASTAAGRSDARSDFSAVDPEGGAQ